MTGPQGLPLDPKLSVEKAKWLEKQRNREYNEFLMKVYDRFIKPSHYYVLIF